MSCIVSLAFMFVNWRIFFARFLFSFCITLSRIGISIMIEMPEKWRVLNKSFWSPLHAEIRFSTRAQWMLNCSIDCKANARRSLTQLHHDMPTMVDGAAVASQSCNDALFNGFSIPPNTTKNHSVACLCCHFFILQSLIILWYFCCPQHPHGAEIHHLIIAIFEIYTAAGTPTLFKRRCRSQSCSVYINVKTS